MHKTNSQSGGFWAQRGRPSLPGILALCILLAVALTSAGCSRAPKNVSASPAEREAALRQVATDYARSGDLAQAQAALNALDVANPGQLLLTLAEADISAGRDAADIEPLARLTDALGVRSPKLIAYLAPTSTPTALPTHTPAPTATLAPSATHEPPTSTPEPPTATPEPPTATVTPTPQQARVMADSSVNLRSGPGRAYPVIGQMRAGQEIEIIARNANGDWWQLAWDGQGQAWVAGTVVNVLGPIDTVAVAQNIPAPPPQPTAAPRPTATPTIPAGPDFRVIEKRLWNVIETGGAYDGTSVKCGEKRELHVRVLDAAGNPLNGVTVKANLGAKEEYVTGHKGVPGEAEFVLGGGQEITIIRDVDGREVTSDYVAGLTTDSRAIPFDVLIGAGFCTDDATCNTFISSWGCKGHHSWTVTFRRSY